MGRHALLSASSSHRWLACPPSARLCENYEDKGSEYAVVRQIICTYILHIKCACISDGMDKHSKFLHLFAQLI